MSVKSSWTGRMALRAAACAGLVLAVSAASAQAASFDVVYNWTGGASGTAGWSDAAVPSASWYSVQGGVGGLKMRPIKKDGTAYLDGARGSWEFQAPAGTTIVRAQLSGLDATQDERQRPRIYLAPQPGDDGGIPSNASWGRETVSDGDSLPASLSLTPQANTSATELRVYLRTRECGGSNASCVDVAPGTQAQLDVARITITLDDASAPQVGLSVSPSGPGWTNQANASVSLTAQDAQSGISSASFTAAGASPASGSLGSWSPDLSGTVVPQLAVAQSPSTTIGLPALGVVSVAGRAVNGAAVAATSSSATVRVDRVAPKVTLPRKLVGGGSVVISDVVSGKSTSGIASASLTVGSHAGTQTKPCAGGVSSCAIRIPSFGGALTGVAVDVAGNATPFGGTVDGAAAKTPKPGGGSQTKPKNPGTKPHKPNAGGSKPGGATTKCPTGTFQGKCRLPLSDPFCKKHPKSKQCGAAISHPKTPKTPKPKPAKGCGRSNGVVVPCAVRETAKAGCNRHTAMLLSGPSSFAVGHYCRGRDAITFRGRFFTANCQAPTVRGCVYQIVRVKPRSGERSATGRGYCAVYPHDMNNQKVSTGSRPGPVDHDELESRIRRTRTTANTDCNRTMHDTCKAAYDTTVPGVVRKAISDFAQPHPGIRAKLGPRDPKDAPTWKPQNAARKRLAKDRCSEGRYLPLSVYAALVNNDFGGSTPLADQGASGAPDAGYAASHNQRLPICTAVDLASGGRNHRPTTEQLATTTCSESVRVTDLAYFGVRWVTQGSRFTMSRVKLDSGMLPQVGLSWVYTPTEAVAGNFPAGYSRYDRLAAWCRRLAIDRPKATGGFGFTNPLWDPNSSKPDWGHMLACGINSVRTK